MIIAKHQHASALEQERESRRRSHIEQVSEVIYETAQCQVEYTTRLSLSVVERDKGGISPETQIALNEKRLELGNAILSLFQSISVLWLVSEEDGVKAVREWYRLLLSHSQLADNIDSLTEDEIEKDTKRVDNQNAEVVNALRRSWLGTSRL